MAALPGYFTLGPTKPELMMNSQLYLTLQPPAQLEVSTVREAAANML